MATKKQLYKHILLATDLSEHSNFVAKRAAQLAAGSGAKISVVHVLGHTPMAYAGEFSIPIDVQFELELKKQAENQLAKLSKKHGILPKSQYVVLGSVKLAVSDLAKKIKADLIVVGTHSHQGFDILLGSQANSILHAAPCDTLVVRIK